MIHVILAELRRNQQSLSLADLSQRLEVDRTVIECMVTTLVRRGHLVEVGHEEAAGPCACGCATCPRRVSRGPVPYRLAERVGE